MSWASAYVVCSCFWVYSFFSGMYYFRNVPNYYCALFLKLMAWYGIQLKVVPAARWLKLTWQLSLLLGLLAHQGPLWEWQVAVWCRWHGFASWPYISFPQQECAKDHWFLSYKNPLATWGFLDHMLYVTKIIIIVIKVCCKLLLKTSFYLSQLISDSVILECWMWHVFSTSSQS